MAAAELTFELLLEYFREKNGVVKNKDCVRHFKKYLTNPEIQGKVVMHVLFLDKYVITEILRLGTLNCPFMYEDLSLMFDNF